MVTTVLLASKLINHGGIIPIPDKLRVVSFDIIAFHHKFHAVSELLIDMKKLHLASGTGLYSMCWNINTVYCKCLCNL